jgi:nanoRNase/pAp phosphatase (c-di-AMP/oligoRNAs hydrolase)
MRLVEGVRVAVAIKTYPDGKATGKIRSNPDAKVAEVIAGYFGGGGHAYTAGFKIYEKDLEKVQTDLVAATSKALTDYDHPSS